MTIPPAPAKYSGEKHIPLPDEDDFTSYHTTSSTSISWPPSFTTTIFSSHNAQIPLRSPLSSLADLRSLPNDSITLHPLLRPTGTILDLASSHFALSYGYNPEHMLGPATHPPAPSLTLKSTRLPFVVIIAPTATSYVTVMDVLWGLYTTLRLPLSFEHQELIAQSSRLTAIRACRNCDDQSLRRVDLLLGATKFTGLMRLKDRCWEIIVS